MVDLLDPTQAQSDPVSQLDEAAAIIRQTQAQATIETQKEDKTA